MSVIQKFDVSTGTLSKSQISKVNKLIELKCIQKLNPHCYKCNPIKGYNSNIYTINIIGTNRFTCGCQWFTMKGLECSHIAAVKRFINNELKADQRELFV